jgi:ankyrin repeat protein
MSANFQLIIHLRDYQMRKTSELNDLFCACRDGDLKRATELLSQSNQMLNESCVISTDPVKKTPLKIACENGHTEIVKLLLEQPDLDINAFNGNSITAIYLACKNGHTEIVNLLLADTRTTIEFVLDEGRTPLLRACEAGHAEIVSLLLKAPKSKVKVNVEDITAHYVTPFFYACQNGHKEVIRLLLADPRTDVNKPRADNNRATPFFVACQNGHTDVVRLLLADARTNVNASTNQGNTPLSIACENGHEEVVRLLLADPRIDHKMAASCYPAYRKGFTKIIMLFITDFLVNNITLLNSTDEEIVKKYQSYYSDARRLEYYQNDGKFYVKPKDGEPILLSNLIQEAKTKITDLARLVTNLLFLPYHLFSGKDKEPKGIVALRESFSKENSLPQIIQKAKGYQSTTYTSSMLNQYVRGRHEYVEAVYGTLAKLDLTDQNALLDQIHTIKELSVKIQKYKSSAY